MDDAVQRVIDGRVWEQFCDTLKAAGQTVLRDDAPTDPLDRAEGWRYLTRLARVALEMMVEHADPDFPVFYAASHETVKIGADNPDNSYLNATIRGDREYRVRGTRGTTPFLSFATKANRLGVDGTLASTGELDASDMAIEPDGSFEIVLSAHPQAGNWLPLAADSSMLIVRRTFLDRANESVGDLSIECIGGPAAPEPLDPASFAAALGAAAAFVAGTAHTFADLAAELAAQSNRFVPLDQARFVAIGGDPAIHYLHGAWALGPGEALVIDTPIPECEIWNFQLDNHWMESLDYRYLPVHLNAHTATPNADGTVTIVVAAENPGVANFVTTAGHHQGTMLLRWTKATSFPVPACKVVPVGSLGAGR